MRTLGEDWAALSMYVLIGDLGPTNSASASRSACRTDFANGSLGCPPSSREMARPGVEPGFATTDPDWHFLLRALEVDFGLSFARVVAALSARAPINS
jgi:hypothetical protein